MVDQIVPRNEHDVKNVKEIKGQAELRDDQRPVCVCVRCHKWLTEGALKPGYDNLCTECESALAKEECADGHCGEDVFRDGPLCLEHFVEVETAAWDDEDAERQATLEAVGYIFGDLVEVPA